jgi:hypothetical protein
MAESTELAPTNLLALRDGKQRAETLISARFAEGLIDQDELERRLEAVQDARTMAELERLIIDLIEPGSSPRTALAPRSSTPSVALARLEDIPEHRRIVARFGSFEQRGRWIPARHNVVVDVFAEAVIDLREAVLGPGETVFELKCVLASAEVIVPPGLAVRVDAHVSFASVERDPEIPSDPLEPGDPVVVLSGSIVFAAVELKERRPGERGRDARRRHRKQRKALREAK